MEREIAFHLAPWKGCLLILPFPAQILGTLPSSVQHRLGPRYVLVLISHSESVKINSFLQVISGKVLHFRSKLSCHKLP
jgi:hypothetical protein